MTISFDNLRKFDIGTDPVDYPLYQISAWDAVLQLRPAGEKNKAYHNALLKRNAKLSRRFRAGKITRAMLKENREHDKVLYAQFVIAGWTGVLDDEGNEAAFSVESCRKFLDALPSWIFEEVRFFALDPTNFLADDEPDEDDVDGLSGN